MGNGGSGSGGGGAGAGAGATTVTSGGVAGMEHLNEAEKLAIQSYSAYGYGYINTILRGTPRDAEIYTPALVQAFAAKGSTLAGAMTKGRTVRDMVTWRGTSMQFIGGADLRVGSTFTDKGFLSTSLSRGIASQANFAKDAILKISVSKGTRALDLAHVGSLSHEREILLSPNTKLRVTKITRVAGKPTTVSVTVVK